MSERRKQLQRERRKKKRAAKKGVRAVESAGRKTDVLDLGGGRSIELSGAWADRTPEP